MNKKYNLTVIRETIVDKIYYILEDQILSGELEPGAKLSEAKIAQEFGVSRAPAREALLRLEAAKLLDKSHLGRSIVELSIEEIRETYEIKNIIEAYAAMKAALYASKQDFETLKSYLDNMFDCIDPPNFQRLTELNKAFHDRIVYCCQNKQLIELYNHRLRAARWTSISVTLRYRQIVKEHKMIYNALVRRNGKRVRELMELHTKRGLDCIISQMISRGIK